MIILHEIAAASAITPSAAAKKTLFINTADGRPWIKDSSGVSTPLDGNTILYGTAAPTTEGVDGNFYIRTTTSFIYGPKVGGVWPAGISLVGPGFGGVTPQTTEFIVLKAAAFIPRTTTGAGINSTEAPTNKENFDYLEFDAGTDEFSQIDIVMPKDWNLGTVTGVVHWTAASGSGDVVFGIRAVSHANDDAIDIAFGTAQTVTDTLTAIDDYCISPSTGPITIAGTLAAGNNVTFELYRGASAGGDNLGVDAQVSKVVLTYTKL